MKYIYILLVFLILGLQTSCDTDNPVVTEIVEDNSKIIISPDTVNLVNQHSNFVAFARKDAKQFSWKVKSKPEWLTILDSNGFSSGESQRIRMYGNTILDKKFNISGELLIEIPGYGDYKVVVNLSVGDMPELVVRDTTIRMSEYGLAEFDVINNGGGKKDVKIILSNPKLTYSMDTMRVQTMPFRSIKIYAELEEFLPGTYTEYAKMCTINDTITVKIIISVPEITRIKNNSNDILAENSPGYFYIYNTGNVPVNWQSLSNIHSNAIKFSAASTIIPVGDSLKITYTIDKKFLNIGQNSIKYEYTLNGINGSYVLYIYNCIPKQNFTNYNILDAKSIESRDEIVLLTFAPNKLIVIDFEGKVKKSINLDYAPVRLSNISNDRIIITYQNKLGLFDLNSFTNIKYYDIDAIPSSLVLDKDWAYLSKTTNISIPSLHYLNLESSEIIEQKNSFGGNLSINPLTNTLYVIRSNDFSIYNTSNGVPSAIVKFYYSNGIPLDFMMNSYDRFITRRGCVYSLSTVESTNNQYLGYLGISEITAVSQSSHSDIMVLASDKYDPNETGFGSRSLWVCNSKTYAPIQAIKLPDYGFLTQDKRSCRIINANIRHIFLKSDLSKVFVMTTSDTTNANWAFQLIDLK